MLTSAEAIAAMETKKKKKQEEQEAKEARKIEREEKKKKREEEAARKAVEKQQKAAERETKRLQKEAEKKRKAEERLQKQRNALKPSNRSVRLRKTCALEVVVEHERREESSDQSMCSVCLGKYEDDFIDGELQKEWVRCTNTENCGLWMHSDCLSTEGNYFVCFMCNVCCYHNKKHF